MTRTRIVLASDFHGDYSMMGVSRFDEVAAGVRQAVEYAKKEEGDIFIFLGDLADPDTGGDTFKSIELLQESVLNLQSDAIVSILISGNHDTDNGGTGATTLTPLKALENHFPDEIFVAERPRVIDYDCFGKLTRQGNERNRVLRFLCLPYTAPSHAYVPAEVAKSLMKESEGMRVIVLGHLMIPGIIPGSETKDMPRGREVLFPIAETTNAFMRFNGHFHRRQSFDPGDGGPPIRIPGSLAILAFGEENNEPGFLVVDLP